MTPRQGPRAPCIPGPLGSTIHVLRADADTITELAAIDWSRHFRRVCLDPVRGLVTLMSPSYPHEDLTAIFDDIVDAAGSTLTGATKKLRSLRLRAQGDPPGTGMEPDCAFYVGERAKDYYTAFGVTGMQPSRPSLNASPPTWWSRSKSPVRRQGQGRTLRRDGCAGAVASARQQGFLGGSGGILRAVPRGCAAHA